MNVIDRNRQGQPCVNITEKSIVKKPKEETPLIGKNIRERAAVTGAEGYFTLTRMRGINAVLIAGGTNGTAI